MNDERNKNSGLMSHYNENYSAQFSCILTTVVLLASPFAILTCKQFNAVGLSVPVSSIMIYLLAYI